MVHEIVGEGTYGCVIKPSMKCEDNEKRNYSNKVSKVMLEKHAKEEYEEVHKISSVPGIEKYILIPKLCKPKIDKEFLSNVKNCKNEKLKKKRISIKWSTFSIFLFKPINRKEPKRRVNESTSLRSMVIFHNLLKQL